MGRRRSKRKSSNLLFWLIPACAIAWFLLQISPVSMNDGIHEIDQQTDGLAELFKPESIDTSAVESAILSYTNVERSKVGLNSLVWDDRLAVIAREHSKDMAENNYFSHTNLRGENPTDRAIRNGYPIRKNLGGGWYSEGIGENIGKMPTGQVIGIGYVANDADSIARAQVDSWMESKGHRCGIPN